MSRESERKRAISLKALDASEFIRRTFPLVLQQMTPVQIDQVQRVLDAAVVNPDVEREVKEIAKQAFVSEQKYAPDGKLTYVDPKIAHRVKHAKDDYIKINNADYYVRLDFTKLLAPDAFKPQTNNPDEAAYLLEVLDEIRLKGVWFGFKMWMVEDEPGKAYTRRWDSRTFLCWLQVGNGDTIEGAPKTGGRLTREVLFSTQWIGAGYSTNVWKGPTRQALNTALRRLLRDIEAGEQQHAEIAKIRRRAFPGVTRISDTLGGASYPSETIWIIPRQLVLQAMAQMTEGDVWTTGQLLVVAATLTTIAARALHDYLDDFTSGAGLATKVLGVAKTAGRVAEAYLIVRTVGTAVVRRLSAETAATGVSAGASGGTGVGAGASAGGGARIAAGPGQSGAVSRTGASAGTSASANPAYANTMKQTSGAAPAGDAYAKTVQQAEARIAAEGGAARQGNSKLAQTVDATPTPTPTPVSAHEANVARLNNELLREVTALQNSRGRTGVSPAELDAIFQRVEARFGLRR